MNAVQSIEAAELTATEYRAARRLADRLERTDYVRLNHQQACELCGVRTWPAARRLLAGLHHRHNLFHVATNGFVIVTWEVGHRQAVDNPIQIGAGYAQDLPEDEQPDPNRRDSRQIGSAPEPDEPENYEKPDPNRRESRSFGANRADSARGDEGSLYIKGYPRIARKDILSSLPLGGAGGGEEPALTAEQERAFAMLTDPAVNLDPRTSYQLALAFDLDEVRRQCARYVVEHAAQRVYSPGVLRKRFDERCPASITDAVRATDWWERHWTDADDAEERRRIYTIA
ncbi:MAG: hypothetical protein U0X20_23700 [Caldilineaceae bacterium]